MIFAVGIRQPLKRHHLLGTSELLTKSPPPCNECTSSSGAHHLPDIPLLLTVRTALVGSWAQGDTDTYGCMPQQGGRGCHSLKGIAPSYLHIRQFDVVIR